MARYVMLSRRRSFPVRSDFDDCGDEQLLGQTVIEREGWRDPQPTGLLDASGDEIHRLPEPMGFCRRAGE